MAGGSGGYSHWMGRVKAESRGYISGGNGQVSEGVCGKEEEEGLE